MDDYLLPLPSGTLLVFAVAAIGTGGNEFAKLMPYHILRNIYRNMLPAVMDSDRMSYE